MPTLLTLGDIAKRIGEPIHRVRYAIESRKIEPAGRAGQLRMFLESDVELIQSVLRRIDDAKGGVA
jgi:hypothetical protein